MSSEVNSYADNVAIHPTTIVVLRKCPWAEHFTSWPKRGVSTLSSASTFNRDRASMSGLHALEAKIVFSGATSGFEAYAKLPCSNLREV